MRIESDPVEPIAGAPGALVLFSDIACPWSTVAVLRLRAARAELGLDEQLAIIHLAHPLELTHDIALPRRVIDAETVACAATVPDFGWSLWQRSPDDYPVSTLLPLQAVQVARLQSEAAAEELDLALRRALFVESRCITVLHEIRAAARNCRTLDIDLMLLRLEAGFGQAAIFRQSRLARAGAAACSGQIVLPDGSSYCNPGIDAGWIGPPMPRGVPVVRSDDASAFRDLVRKAAIATVEEAVP